MLYCNDCAKKNNYPPTFFKSLGTCEICGEKRPCNDRASSTLPKPTKQEEVLKKLQNDGISVFAFKTGKIIESIIHEHTNNLEERNQQTEAKILDWYSKTRDNEFAKHFNITTIREGGLKK